jgi:hypothetical protein
MGQLSSIFLLIFVFVFLVSNVVAPPAIAIEGVHWARDGLKFACRVDECDASYTDKYNLVQHLWAHHNVVMEPNKPRCPSIWEEGPRIKDHIAMNAQVLSNPTSRN